MVVKWQDSQFQLQSTGIPNSVFIINTLFTLLNILYGEKTKYMSLIDSFLFINTVIDTVFKCQVN